MQYDEEKGTYEYCGVTFNIKDRPPTIRSKCVYDGLCPVCEGMCAPDYPYSTDLRMVEMCKECGGTGGHKRAKPLDSRCPLFINLFINELGISLSDLNYYFMNLLGSNYGELRLNAWMRRAKLRGMKFPDGVPVYMVFKDYLERKILKVFKQGGLF